MEPFTIALFVAAIGATLASTAMSYDANNKAAKQTQYNAEYEAQAEELKAKEEEARRGAQARLEMRQTRSRRASIEAGFAKSGLLMTGTPTFMLEEQAKSDAMNIGEANRLSGVSFMRSMEKAKVIRQQGEFQSDALKYGATTSLVQGAGSLAMSGAMFGAAGGFGPGTSGTAGGGVKAADSASKPFAADLRSGKYVIPAGGQNALFQVNP